MSFGLIVEVWLQYFLTIGDERECKPAASSYSMALRPLFGYTDFSRGPNMVHIAVLRFGILQYVTTEFSERQTASIFTVFLVVILDVLFLSLLLVSKMSLLFIYNSVPTNAL